MRAIFILILGIFLGLSMILKELQRAFAAIIREIKLEAFQYGFSPDPVVVKKGDKVRLIITSGDVTHGIYIKEY